MNINFPKLFRRLLRVIIAMFLLYLLSLVFVYFKQERFFFNPKHLDKSYVFKFQQKFEELNIPVDKDIYLNGLLFNQIDNTKDIVRSKAIRS